VSAVRPAASATYRLQLHAGVTLAQARALVPYLARLGVSHVYASPLLQSRRASRHGYDVVDPTRLDPKLGTEADLAGLVARLRTNAMGLVVDLVPNHMAIGAENRFWDDVLAHGEASRYARWFDVAWRDPNGRATALRIPILGDPRPQILARGELRLACDGGRIRLRYHEHAFPLDPATLAPLIDRVAGPRANPPGARGRAPVRPPDRSRGSEGGPPLTRGARRELREIAAALHALPPREASASRRAERADAALGALAALVRRDATARIALERALATVTGRALAALLEQQAYRLVHWRRAAGDVNYRRFFAVSELVGLRVEDDDVFAATHERALAWARAGQLDALRIDHVDGLADPLGYLRRLRAALDAAGARDVLVLVEKILTGDEQLRAEWPVAGTTGYEYATALDTALIDPRGHAALVAWYDRAVAPRRAAGFRAVAWDGKREMATSWLAPDVRRLADLLTAALARRPPASRRHALRAAVAELLVSFPIYRTYVDGRRGSPARPDRAAILRALADARRRGNVEPAALRQVADVLVRPGALDGRGEFVRRFQQVSGALMAKGVEDTALYRWVPLASRNEVGADPSAPLAGAVARLHAHHALRARRFPAALSATTTHDTKRSADARARLHVLAEIPERWSAQVAAFRARHRSLRRRVDGRRAPDAVTEYLFYQSAVAIWPASDAPVELADVRERLRAYVQKAAREAGVHTSWLAPASTWEDALDRFVAAVCDLPAFRADMRALVASIGRAGLWTALARTLVHLTAPGVPDLYQGDELWSFTLVDPDNRRDVDFAARAAMLAALERRPVDTDVAAALLARPEDGRVKLHTIRTALALRRRAVDVFRGGYVALDRGQPSLRHVIAFARTAERRTAITIVPRLPYALMDGRPEPPVGARVWRDTALRLPAALRRRHWTNVLTGARVETADGMLRLADALAAFPVALLF
jgi:(1->4)-alpha-D-glucan 1-alpha-D-glucosylmutase